MKPPAAATLLAVLAAGALALTGCGQPAPTAGQPASPAAGPISVVTSTDVYGAVATAVAGDRVSVTAIIDNPDADPHEYESTAKDAAAVGAAKLMVANGADYDPFAGKLIEVAVTKPAVIEVSELSGLRPANGEFNEHVWYHLPTMAKLASQLATELGKVDPAGVATFTANAAAFEIRLDELGAKLNTIKTNHAGQRVALTELVPGYLVDAAGLVNTTPDEFTEAAEEGNDPPAAVLNETLELFRAGPGADPVKALLLNPQAQNASTQQLERAARDAGVPVVTVTETLPAGVTDYVTWMGGQIDQLTAAMDKR